MILFCQKQIAFHNWGNGDFDVIDEAGQVYFCNHSIEAFLDGQSPKSLSTGIALTYAIYLLYLEHKGDEMLELYIKRRQMLRNFFFN